MKVSIQETNQHASYLMRRNTALLRSLLTNQATVDTCSAIHPSISCKKQFIRLYACDFNRGLRLYGVFALIRVVVGILKRNLNIPEVLQLWLRSCFYYSTYISLAMSAM